MQYIHRLIYTCDSKVKFVRGHFGEYVAFFKTTTSRYEKIYDPINEQKESVNGINEREQNETGFKFDSVVKKVKIFRNHDKESSVIAFYLNHTGNRNLM